MIKPEKKCKDYRKCSNNLAAYCTDGEFQDVITDSSAFTIQRRVLYAEIWKIAFTEQSTFELHGGINALNHSLYKRYTDPMTIDPDRGIRVTNGCSSKFFTRSTLCVCQSIYSSFNHIS